MLNRDQLLKDIIPKIMSMEMDEKMTFKLNDDWFLYIENWRDPKNEAFTTLELNSGEETEDGYILDYVLECAVCDFGNEQEIAVCAEYLLLCCE